MVGYQREDLFQNLAFHVRGWREGPEEDGGDLDPLLSRSSWLSMPASSPRSGYQGRRWPGSMLAMGVGRQKASALDL